MRRISEYTGSVARPQKARGLEAGHTLHRSRPRLKTQGGYTMKLSYHLSRVVHTSPRLSPSAAVIVRTLRSQELEHVIVRKFV